MSKLFQLEVEIGQCVIEWFKMILKNYGFKTARLLHLTSPRERNKERKEGRKQANSSEKKDCLCEFLLAVWRIQEDNGLTPSPVCEQFQSVN